MKTYPSQRNLAFTDVETTGLQSWRHEIISLATVIRTQDGEEIASGEWHMHPRWPDLCQARALETNGYTLERWDTVGTVEHAVAMKEYSEMAEGCIFVAHNAKFDWQFVEYELERTGQKWHGDYHALCTMSLAWREYLRAQGAMKGVSLAAVCDYYGISNEGAHGAMRDVERMIQIYDRLVST